MGNKKKEEVVIEETTEVVEEVAETPAEVVEEVAETPAEVVEEVAEEIPVEEEIEECDVKAPGVVIADRLNVRKEADKDGDVVTIISKGTGVEVNLTKSTDEFYYVTVLVNNEFVDAYCVKEFIEIK